MTMRALLVAARSFFTFQLPATELIDSTSPEGQASDANYRFHPDGLIQERRDLSIGGTSLTTSQSSPWSDDPGEDGVGKFIRLEHLSGTDRRTDGLGNAFVELDVLRNFTFQNPSTSGPYSGSSTYDVELSLDGSTIHAAQVLTVTLANQGP